MKLIDINNYWLHRYDHLWEDDPMCFVCGKRKRLEKCHLIPEALGGNYDVDNLVLLCNEHHKQAPNISLSKDIMLKWIEEESGKYCTVLNMKTDDIQRMIESTHKIMSRVENVVDNKKDVEYLSEFMLDKYSNNSLHISSHPEANIRTRVLFCDYIANYENLEVDYLKFLLSKSRDDV